MNISYAHRHCLPTLVYMLTTCNVCIQGGHRFLIYEGREEAANRTWEKTQQWPILDLFVLIVFQLTYASLSNFVYFVIAK